MGQMMGLMVTAKGLPSTYNKDLQESVEPLLDCVKTVSDSIRILTGVVSTLSIRPKNMLASLTPDMLATGMSPMALLRMQSICALLIVRISQQI